MEIAETVTFSGSGGTSTLERAAHLRDDVAFYWGSAGAKLLLLWHGLPLMRQTEGGWRAVWLPTTHKLAACFEPAMHLFLGCEGGEARFAMALPDWRVAPGDVADSVQHPDLPEGDVFVDLRGVMAGLSPFDAGAAVTARAMLEWHRRHGFCGCCGAKTTPVNGGWLRECPQCARKHFPHIEPVAIMLITRANSVLLGRSPGWPVGMYSLLAGFIEPGETVEAAVRREVLEEVGVEVGRVRYLASQPWPFPASLMIGCHGLATSRDLTPDPDEIEDARWLTREQVMDVFAGRNDEITPARRGSIAQFLLENWLADRLD